jgi:hypothetical protein
MEGRTLSRSDYYALHGLLSMAAEYNRKLRDLEAAALRITGEEDELGGHTSDALANAGYGGPYDHGADGLLGKLGIEVEP